MTKPTLLIVLLTLATSSLGFVPSRTSARTFFLSPLFAEYEVVAEPDGGEEVDCVSTMDNTKVKQMSPSEGNIKGEGGEEAFKFWISTVVESSLILSLKKETMKGAKKKANFPGFRKGQIPPWAMPEIYAFSIQEALLKTIENVVSAYGLKSLPGGDGEVTVLEDVEQMVKGYKDGTSLPFTATFNAIYDPEVERPSAADSPVPSVEDAIDVEVEQ
eukprot:CAMPEP_0194033000 /NCGR_PEP_ID=MMETSP0009_2-20130614/5821_1 /TAXON_ID=210454 /ORGANISM="Grammatophora oceanica, Strain CCMP 410" /LENGTH=215 /DNA_ID=CAMNT_0038673599 /DNA_START=1 /DNA_END=648 /DNA_ORIENTATION=+